jgi:hypothetical protein
MAGCWRIPGLAPILDWQQYRGIRRHARCRAIIFILISFSVSLLVVPLPWVVAAGCHNGDPAHLVDASAGAGAGCNGK